MHILIDRKLGRGTCETQRQIYWDLGHSEKEFRNNNIEVYRRDQVVRFDDGTLKRQKKKESYRETEKRQ